MDPFNEGISLQALLPRARYCPAVIYADKIYRNQAKLKFCKTKRMELSGPLLGRLPKDPEIRKNNVNKSERILRYEIPLKASLAKANASAD